MTDKNKTSKDIKSLDKSNNDRHNENARAAAAPKTQTPRINTDNL